MLLPTNVLTDENYVTEEEDDYQWWTEEDLWKFPPPPPRPPFLELPYSDGLTTCDLCLWAEQPLDGTDNVPIADVTWPMILVLVSLLSAAIGALFMVVFLHLKLRLSGRTAPSRPECLVSFDPPTDRVHHHHQLHHHQRQMAQLTAGDHHHLNHVNHMNHLNDLNSRRAGAGPIVRRSGADGAVSKHTGPGRPSRNGRGRGGGGGGGGGRGGDRGGEGGGGRGGIGLQLSVNPGDWFRWFRRKRDAVLPPDAVASNQNSVRANHYTVEEAAAAVPVVVYASVVGGGGGGGQPDDGQPRPPSAVDDALYTELDRVPTPAYHNAGYAFDQRGHRGSAYYSDLYEPIDPYHRLRHHHHHHHHHQDPLPSDYV